MVFPQNPLRSLVLARILHGLSGMLLLIFIGFPCLNAQGMGERSDGFFDRDEIGAKLPLEVGKLQSPVAWKNLWRRTLQRGPLSESALEKEFATRHGLENRLALIGGFCLGGGVRASRYLENWYHGGRKVPEELVFLCLGSSAGSLPLRLDFLRRLALSKKNPTVVRLAAAISWIERSLPKVSPEVGELFAERPEGLFVRMLRDQCQSPPNFGPDARTWVFKSLGKPGPNEKQGGGFEHLVKSLAFLNLAAVPSSLDPKQVLDLLAQESQYRGILSLVIGRQIGSGSLKDLQAKGLSLPQFFSGIQSADAALQQRILEGPGGARGADYNELWWAAGARLVSAERVEALCRECSKGSFGEKGLQVILRRVLTAGLKLPSAASLEAKQPTPAGAILLYLQKRNPDVLKGLSETLHPKILYALQRLYPPEQEVTPQNLPLPRENGSILWSLLQKRWAPRGAYPGTQKRLRFQLLSQWVARLFLSGSSYMRSQLGSSAPGNGYLPKGIRANKQGFFRVLSLFLKEHPFFGV